MDIKSKVLCNSSDKDVLNYKIEEAMINPATGDPLWDAENQTYKKTGITLEWSIKAGETLSFPEYVANYLMGIYGFLKHTNVKRSQGEAKPDGVPADGPVKEDGNDSIEE